MGLGGINLTQLLVILAIVLLVFGTKRVKSLGSDLGGAIRGFRRAMDSNGDSNTGRVNDDERQQAIESDEDAKRDAGLSEQADSVRPGY